MDFTDLKRSVGRVLVDDQHCGTCFFIPTASSRRFAVTATHVIREAEINGKKIKIDIGSTSHEVRVVFSSGIRPYGNDIAVLGVIDEQILPPPAQCSLEPVSGAAITYGFPIGLYTNATSFSLDLKGEEETKAVKQTVLAFSSLQIPPDAHPRLSGMSGAPVAVRFNDGSYTVVGVFTRLEKDAFGGRGYVTPMKALQDICKNNNCNLILMGARSVERSNFDYKLLLGILRGLESAERERYAWDILSGLFFQGIPVDSAMRHILDGSNDLDICDRAVSEYIYSRLLLKRGDKWKGFPALNTASALAQKASNDINKRISSVCRMRDSIEQPIKSQEERKADFLEAVCAVEKNCCGMYCIYELASATAQEAMTWFEKPLLLSDNIDYARSLSIRHNDLVNSGGGALGRQIVSGNSINVLYALWSKDWSSTECLVLDGFSFSRRDRNSIYFVQMLLAKGVLAARKSFIAGAATFILAARLMRQGGLTRNHEGIRQLIVFLRSFLPEMASLIDSIAAGDDVSICSDQRIADATQLADLWSAGIIFEWDQLFFVDHRLISI